MPELKSLLCGVELWQAVGLFGALWSGGGGTRAVFLAASIHAEVYAFLGPDMQENST